MARVFLTGASGYVGGQVLHDLAAAHPELTIRILVRDAAKAQTITAAYPDIQVVEGTLQDEDIVGREASNADVVLNLAAAGNLKSVEIIHKALLSREGKPAHWIQLSGASALAAAEVADSSRTPGSASELVFDDLDGVATLRDFIKRHPARAVDNYLLSVAGNDPQIKTALVLPPIIYGRGQGPVNQRSIQIPDMARATLQRGQGFQVGKGLNRWSDVHIQDLGRLFLKLVEDALADQATTGLWNLDGVYLTGVGERSFGEISRQVANVAAKQGWIPSSEVDEGLGDEDKALLPHGTVIFETNARGKGRRAVERLGWRPQHADGMEAEISRAVEEEAKSLGLTH